MELSVIFIALSFAALIAAATNERRFIEGSSMTAGVLVLMESIIIARTVSLRGEYSPLAFFSVDALGALLILMISCIGLAAVAYSIAYLRKETAKHIIDVKHVRRYFVLLNLFLVAMLMAVSVESPIFAWISVEATTLSTAFLISFYNKPSAMEAAWKYLIINSVGLLLGFFGSLLYFTAFSATDGSGIASWQNLLAQATSIDPLIAKIAFIFVLIGYGTKAGLVPMHTWLPDAHSKAPAPISALLSGVLLNVAFLIMVKFKIVTDAVVGSQFSQNLLTVFGILSLFVAALIILDQKSYKRLLAYSSIENMGVLALGFGFGGLGTIAAILHAIYHSFIKSALFFLSGNFLLKYHSAKIANVKGALRVVPITSILFVTAFFAVTGAPPFGIFLTKVLILSSGVTLHPIVTTVALILMAIVFIGFFKHASAMVFGQQPSDIASEKESAWLILPPMLLLVLAFCLSFYQPHFLQILVHNAVLHY